MEQFYGAIIWYH